MIRKDVLLLFLFKLDPFLESTEFRLENISGLLRENDNYLHKGGVC